MRNIILVNPQAGRGAGPNLCRDLLRRQPQLTDARIIDAPDALQAKRELIRALSPTTDTLVVIGGDGSLNLAVDALLKCSLGKQVRLCPISAGTGSDFARALHPRLDIDLACRMLTDSRSRPLDALEVTWPDGSSRYGINTFSAGVAGLVSATMASRATRSGAAYLRATLSAFFRYHACNCRVTVDGRDWHEGPLYLLAVTNGSHFGQGMQIAPKAQLDDGLAEVLAVTPMSRLLLLLRLVRLYLGNHLGAPYVRYCRGQTVTVIPTESLPAFDLDGEMVPVGRVTIRLLPGVIRLACQDSCI